jgi:hypothetical protein
VRLEVGPAHLQLGEHDAFGDGVRMIAVSRSRSAAFSGTAITVGDACARKPSAGG